MKNTLIIFILLLCFSCNHYFKGEGELKEWLTGKEFQSTTKDYDQLHFDQSVSFSIQPVTIKIYQNKIKYQNCPPCSYTVLKGHDSFFSGEYWEISFEPSCSNGDSYSLIIANNESYYLVSKAYDSDQLDNVKGTMNRMDAILNRKETLGPEMTITKDDIVIDEKIVDVKYDYDIDEVKDEKVPTYDDRIVTFTTPKKMTVAGDGFNMYSDPEFTIEIANPYKLSDYFYVKGSIDSAFACYDKDDRRKYFFIPIKQETVTDTLLVKKVTIEELKTAIICVEKSYFHPQPDESVKKKSYVVKNDSVFIATNENGFYYSTYITKSGREITGWIKASDLRSIN